MQSKENHLSSDDDDDDIPIGEEEETMGTEIWSSDHIYSASANASLTWNIGVHDNRSVDVDDDEEQSNSCSSRSSVACIRKQDTSMNLSMSSNPDHVKWLLTAIRRIRDQKQRPGTERITSTLRTLCPTMEPTVIEEQLDLAARDGLILRVYANGVVSYKDPGRVVHLKTHVMRVDRKYNMTKVVIRTVKELGSDNGSTVDDVYQHICTAYMVEIADGIDLRSRIQTFLEATVATGATIKDGKRYRVVQPVNVKNPMSNKVKVEPFVDLAFKFKTQVILLCVDFYS